MTKSFARVVAALALLVALAALTTPGSAQSLAFIPTASAIIDGVAYGGGLGPMVAADFDADGDDDLLLGAPGDDGGALYGLRGPVFSDGEAPDLRDAPVLGRGVAGQGFAAALAAGDIDGDGITDALIWSAAGPRRLDVRFGGPAFFDPGAAPAAAAPFIRLGPREPVRSLQVADLDGDGHDDIITGSPDGADGGPRFGSGFNGIAIRFGPFTAGPGTSGVLRPAARAELRVEGASQVGHALMAADLTGDGVPDLLLAIHDDDNDPLLIAVAGPFLREDRTLDIEADTDIRFTVTAVDLGAAMAFGDVDLDGAPDLLLGFEGNRRVSLVSGFAIPPSGPTPLHRIDQVRLSGPAGEGFGSHLASGDFDADGLPDLVVGAPERGARGAVVFLAGSDRRPEIGAVVPAQAPPGATLRIRGHALSGASVSFRDAEGELLTADVVAAAIGEIEVTAPSRDLDAPVLLDVVVSNDAGKTEREAAFTLLPAVETVALLPGRNLQGWTVDSTLADASATEGGSIARILAWDAGAGAWASYAPGGPAAPAESERIRLGQGLWLRVDDPAGVQWRRPSFAAARVQELLAGWNLVMWSGPSGTPVAEAVRPIADALRSLHAWDADGERFRTYAPDRPADLNDAGTLDNGEAFWLLLDEAAAWPQPSAGTPPVARSVAQARAAAVFLKQGGREGTGFLVGETRIITAAHVVQNGHTVQVHFPGGEERTALVVAADGPLDIAVLEVSGVPDGVTRLDWETAASPEPATPVWSWGFPLGDVFGSDTSVSVAGGLVAAHQRNFRDFAVLQTDAAVVPGSSGSPLITADGRLVGVIISYITSGGDDVEGLNLAVDVDANRDRIRALVER